MFGRVRDCGLRDTTDLTDVLHELGEHRRVGQRHRWVNGGRVRSRRYDFVGTGAGTRRKTRVPRQACPDPGEQAQVHADRGNGGDSREDGRAPRPARDASWPLSSVRAQTRSRQAPHAPPSR